MSERMLSRSLQPPRPSEYQMRVSDEIAELKETRKEELIVEAMSGHGPFWNTDSRISDFYDNEQAQAVFALVQKVLAMPTISADTRWRLFEGLLRDGEIKRYAEFMVEQ
jgi:hypothetical protein